MNEFKGRPSVPEHDRRTAAQVLVQLELGLSMERLQVLRHAVAVSRECSRYAGWSEADVEQVLSVIDGQLPASKRLKVLPSWLQDPQNK